MRFLKGLFSFRGRTSRKACWITGLAIGAATIATAAVVVVIIRVMSAAGFDARSIGIPYLSVGDLLFIPVLIVLSALLPLYVRRLHDRNRTGHWIWVGALITVSSVVLLPLLSEYMYPTSHGSWVQREPIQAAIDLIPYFIGLAPVAWLYFVYECYRIATASAPGYPGDVYSHGAVGTVAAIYGVGLIIELGFLRGTVGPNKYGPDPLQPSERHGE